METWGFLTCRFLTWGLIARRLILLLARRLILLLARRFRLLLESRLWRRHLMPWFNRGCLESWLWRRHKSLRLLLLKLLGWWELLNLRLLLWWWELLWLTPYLRPNSFLLRMWGHSSSKLLLAHWRHSHCWRLTHNWRRLSHHWWRHHRCLILRRSHLLFWSKSSWGFWFHKV